MSIDENRILQIIVLSKSSRSNIDVDPCSPRVPASTAVLLLLRQSHAIISGTPVVARPAKVIVGLPVDLVACIIKVSCMSWRKAPIIPTTVGISCKDHQLSVKVSA